MSKQSRMLCGRRDWHSQGEEFHAFQDSIPEQVSTLQTSLWCGSPAGQPLGGCVEQPERANTLPFAALLGRIDSSQTQPDTHTPTRHLLDTCMLPCHLFARLQSTYPTSRESWIIISGEFTFLIFKEKIWPYFREKLACKRPSKLIFLIFEGSLAWFKSWLFGLIQVRVVSD